MTQTSHKILEKTVIISIFVLAFAFSINKIRNWDIWWHLEAGEYILENGSVPKSDLFSYPSAGDEWIDLHWGFQALSRTLYSALGGNGLILFKAITVLAALIAVFRTYTSNNRKPFGLALFFLIILTISQRLLIRPEVLSFILFAVYLKILWAFSRKGTKAVYVLPLLQIVWVNVQGLFVLGIFAVWSFVVGEWMRGKLCLFAPKPGGSIPHAIPHAESCNRPTKHLLAVGILVVTACLINPYGVKGLFFPLTLFTRISGQAQAYSQNIGEFLSVFEPGAPWSILKISYVVILSITICSFVINWKKINPAHVILCAGLGYLSIKSKRNINFFAIAAYPVILYNVEKGLADLGGTAKRLYRIGSRLFRFQPLCLAMLTVAILATAFLAATNRLFIMENKHRSFGLGAEMDSCPTGCIDWIKSNRPQGRMFNNLGLGGFLVYALYPEYKVFIDGRLEVHPERLYKQYLDVMNAPEKNWNGLQDKFGFKWAILSYSFQDTHRLIRYLYYRPDWELAALDNATIVFVETESRGENFKRIDLESFSPQNATWSSIAGFDGPLTAIERLSNQPTPWTRLMPFDLFSMGNLLMTLDKPEKASEIFGLAVKQSPQLKILQNGLGLAYLKLGARDKAICAFGKAAELAPKDAIIYSNLGVAYGQKGLTKKAISAFKRSTDLDSEYEEAFSNLGTAYWEVGQLDNAINAYKRAAALRPEFAEHHYNLAVLYYKKQNFKEATVHARRAKDLGYGKADGLLRKLLQGLTLDS